jgi:hypothetical protein
MAPKLKRRRELSAAIKKAVAMASRIALWPLTILATKINRANRKMIRWAMRHRSRPVYLFAILWLHTTIVGLLVWGLIAVPPQPHPDMLVPAMAGIFVVAKKLLALVVYLVEEGIKIAGWLRHYRRQFPK